MRRISRSLMVLLICAGLANAQANIPYRLLSARDVSTASIKEFDYNVSVDQYLDASAVKRVICQLIQSEKPASYEVLSIGVYFQLDRFIPESDRDLKDSAEHRDHRVAQYHWNKDAPKDSRRLVITKDTKGRSLPEWRFIDFDHAKACR